MKESIKIFSDKNAKKLEDKVEEFLNDKNHILLNGTFAIMQGETPEFVYCMQYNDYIDEPLSPKDNKSFKFKYKK